MRVIGAGPAGSIAAIAARFEGAPVRIYERSAFPKHKVCGEFLSPEAALIFERLNLLPSFLALQPHSVCAARVTIGKQTKSWTFDKPAYGISRFALDRFLLDHAQSAGAELVQSPLQSRDADVVAATGRNHSARRGLRQFGFKAHFSGPVTDRIELVFDRDFYVGINSVEGNQTNVCGLASEALLKRFQFKPDALIASVPALAARVEGLARVMDWLITGPLVYGGRFRAGDLADPYPTGDALGFVDPFTGSGMLGAMATGLLAGRACARGAGSAGYLADCRRLLGRQYRNAALFRRLLDWGVADTLVRLAPGPVLFDMTRPSVSAALQAKKTGKRSEESTCRPALQ